MASEFNARAARAKRPLPLWVDAFYRDTRHLATDETGAYLLMLMAMWSRETADLPDDDAKLARVCGVSLRLWRSRIGAVLRPFFQARDGVLVSKRLREEAAYVERQVTLQSNRRNGENPSNPPENKDVPPTADRSTEQTADYPSQQPNNPTIKNGGGGGARAHASEADQPPEPEAEPTHRERLLVAMGHDPSGLTASGRIVGNPGDMLEAERWGRDLGLTPERQLEVIGEFMAAKRDGPPSSFRYFTEAMRRRAGEITLPPLTPIAQPAKPALYVVPPFDYEAFKRSYGE